MPDTTPTVWGLRAGAYGEADDLFRTHGRLAIGWPAAGDLSALAPSRDAFKERVRTAYPDVKEGAIPGAAGQLYRFVHQMAPGDYVVYPSKVTKQVHIGRITGPYSHDPSDLPEYPNRRAVEWLGAFPRARFKQGPLYEIGSALTLFEVRTYRGDFLAALQPGTASPGPDVPDDEADEAAQVAQVAGDIEEGTRAFVARRLARELKGHPAAAFVAHLLRLLGYNTRVSPPGTDGGIDIVAFRDALGIEPPIVKVQVKSGDGTVGGPQVSQLNGVVQPGEFGLFVTFGAFTHQARAFASTRANLRLMDGEEVIDLVLEHYDRLDAHYKALIPLRRALVPDAAAPDFGA